MHSTHAGPCPYCACTQVCEPRYHPNGDGTHTYACRIGYMKNEYPENCTAKPVVQACSGGTATCTTLAICAGCGFPYGEASTEHQWGEWVSDGNGQHTRTCRNDASHTESQDCSGGRALCNAPAICEVCNEPYGGPDNSSMPSHPNPIIESRAPTCYDEGYYRIICDAPGCTMPFYEIISPANGQHLYNHWDILGDHMHHTDCAVCGEYEDIDCTLWGMLNGETLLTVCPVCGNFGDTPFAVLIAREDAAVPIGTLLVRGIEAPFGNVLYGVTVAGVYGSEVVNIHGEVTITLPIAAESFILVRVNVTDGVETRTEIPFTLAYGQLTFSTDAAGLFLLIPAE